MKENTTIETKFLKLKVMLVVFIGFLVCTLMSLYVLFIPLYDDILGSFSNIFTNVAHSVHTELDISSFTEVNDIGDKNNSIYIRDHKTLSHFRELVNLEYLYTAGLNEDGKPIYLVDGLPLDHDYFVEPGELIEVESSANLLSVLSGDVESYSDVVMAEWGMVYFSGWPVYYYDDKISLIKDGNSDLKPIGAIGMEFDISEYIATLKKSIQTLLGIVLFITIVVLLIIYFMLGKITHPYFRTLALTDFLTGLGNRNAFELDLKKIKISENILLVVCDLNNLKIVNDKYGHSVGDMYIKTFGEYITDLAKDFGKCYRIGGDEFVVIFNEEDIRDSIKIIDEGLALLSKPNYKHLEFAYGFAKYDESSDKNLNDTFIRADALMYDMKKEQKSKKLKNTLEPIL